MSECVGNFLIRGPMLFQVRNVLLNCILKEFKCKVI